MISGVENGILIFTKGSSSPRHSPASQTAHRLFPGNPPNLPIIFAGGGFRHGQHLTSDTERNYPLPNLYVSMLQQLGIETDRFASSTGTMRGLEVA